MYYDISSSLKFTDNYDVSRQTYEHINITYFYLFLEEFQILGF